MTAFLTGVLAIWRIGSLLTNPSDAGPYGMMHEIRRLVGMEYNEYSQLEGSNEFAKMLSCMWCNSVWFGWIYAYTFRKQWDVHWFFVGLALSTAVIVLDNSLE
jgi:hypothetical protein